MTEKWNVTSPTTKYDRYYTAADVPYAPKESIVEKITSGIGTNVGNIVGGAIKPLYPLLILLFVILVVILILGKKLGVI